MAEKRSAERLDAALATCCECAHYPEADCCPPCEARERLATLQREADGMREALERLASGEAMTVSFYIPNNTVGDELKARMDFARAALNGSPQDPAAEGNK